MEKKKSNFLSKLLNKLVWVFSIFVIFFVLFISILKFSLPYLTSKKETIVDFLESYIGGELSYQTLQVDWSGFHPEVKIDQLTWSSKGKVALSVKNLESKINLWETVSSGQLSTQFVHADNITVDLGALDFSSGSTVDTFNFKNYFKTLEINQDLLQHKLVRLTNINVSWQNLKQDHQQSIGLLNYKHRKQKQQLLIESTGDAFKNMRLVFEGESTANTFLKQVKTYVKSESINLNLFFSEKNYSEHDLTAWINFYEQQLSNSKIELKATNPKLLGVNLNADVLSKNNDFYLKTKRLEVNASEQSEVVTSRLELLVKNYLSKSNNQNAYFKASHLNLYSLTSVLKPFYDFEPSIQKLKLDGILNYAVANLSNTNSGIAANFIQLDVKGFRIEQEGFIPKLELNELLLEGIDNKWTYLAKAKDTQILYKPLFKTLIPIKEMDVRGRFILGDERLLSIEHLNFKNQDATAYARGNIRFTNDRIFLNLIAEANNVNVKNLDRYWPRDGSMNQNTLDFLDNGLVSGRAPYGRFVLRGDVAAYPYTQFDGLLDVRAKANNVTLKFMPDWPAGTRINADFNLVNHEIWIDGNRGQLQGVQVKKSRAYFPDIMPSAPELRLSFNATSDNSSFKKVYSSTPLNKILGETLGDIEFSGYLPVAVDINLLLAETTDFSLKGNIAFNGQRINNLPYNLAVDNTHGKLFFDDNGAYTQDLTGSFFNNPLTVEVLVDSYTKNDSLIKVNAKSKVNISKLTESLFQYKNPNINGASDIHFFYEVDKAEVSNESLVLRSQLEGTEIIGPEWFAKKLSAKKPLLFTALKIGNDLDTNISYGRSLSSKVKFDLNDVNKTIGQILLGDIATAKINAPKDGVAIEGYFNQVNVKEWIATFTAGVKNNASTGGVIKLPDWISHINITTPQLIVAGQEFTNVRLNDVALTSDEVRFNLFSEQARASLAFANDGSKLLDIERLNLDLKPWKSISDSDEDVDINIKQYDNWTLKCQRCFIDGYDIGNLELKSSLVDNRINISGKLFIEQFFQATIDANLTQQNSKLKVDYLIPAPGDLLQHWNLKGEMEDTKILGTLEVSWPGLLHDFKLNQLNGVFSLTGEKGAIKNLSDKKARIFSLFSLESIPRRLSLDFSDLFKEGFYYDSITGTFDIKNGILMSKDVSIDGTAADVSVQGSVDLNQQTVNQRVTVIPQLGSSLPVLAGWAIEPTTGLVMFLVSKIFEPALSVVSQIEYQIVGSIDDPKVIELSKTSKEIDVDQALIEKEKERIEAEKNKNLDKTLDKNNNPQDKK